MKRINLNRYSLVIPALFLFLSSYAGVQEEKRKEINKTYPVTASTEFQVDNSFGKVHINTWEQSKITVKVEIITRGRNEERAQKLLDKIRVDIAESSSQISFETILEAEAKSKNEESFEINYTIHMPAQNRLEVSNKFGDIYIANRSGKTEVTSSYGNLKMEDATGFLVLDLSFGNGALGSLGDAVIDVSYGNLEMVSGKKIEMEQKFANIELQKVVNLELESKYGNVEIGQAGDLDIDAQFSGLSLEELTGSLYLEASYVTGFVIDKVNPSFTGIEIYGKFSSYTLNLDKGLKADLEAAFSFSDLKSTDRVDLYYQEKDDNRSEYKGRIGGGDATKKILVKSSYGDLHIK